MNHFRFGQKSRDRLLTCHPNLILVAERALELSPYDFAIIHGWRGEELQNTLVENGVSRTPWPQSKHNAVGDDGNPRSLAIDFAPWVLGAIPWKETHIFAAIAGVMMAAAEDLNVGLRWGGDWDGDGLHSDQTLLDWGHVELKL